MTSSDPGPAWSDPARLWAAFALDPRDPGHAALRASDVDRDRILDVLAEAFAHGRLDRDEYDERSQQVTGSRTLGELPPLVADLLPPAGPTAGLVPARSQIEVAELRQRAVDQYQKARNGAWQSMLGYTLICVIIWAISGFGFPWPAFVLLGTGAHYLNLVRNRDGEIRERERKLIAKQEKARAKLERKRDTEPPS